MTEPPRYPHDCPWCQLLGTYDECDMYYCGGPTPETTRLLGRARPTVIARFGADPSDYISGIAIANECDPALGADRRYRALRVALLIARDAGLL